MKRKGKTQGNGVEVARAGRVSLAVGRLRGLERRMNESNGLLGYGLTESLSVSVSVAPGT